MQKMVTPVYLFLENSIEKKARGRVHERRDGEIGLQKKRSGRSAAASSDYFY